MSSWFIATAGAEFKLLGGLAREFAVVDKKQIPETPEQQINLNVVMF